MDDWVYWVTPQRFRELLDEVREHPEPGGLPRIVDQIRRDRCELTRALERLGLTRGRWFEMWDEAWAAEREARAAAEAPIPDTQTGIEALSHRPDPDADAAFPLSDGMRRLIVELHLRGLELGRIDAWGNLPAGTAAKVTGKAVRPGAADVVRLHFEGRPIGEIAATTGVPVTTAERILASVGEVSVGSRKRTDARARARTIVKLAESGMAYKEIARRVDCSMDTVKNALRRDRRQRYGGKGPAE